MLRSGYTGGAILAFAVCIGTASGQSPTIGNCPVLPSDNIWNAAVDQLPKSTSSDTWKSTIGLTKTLHADFGAGLYNNGPIGIPYITVPGTQTKYPATFLYADESDTGPYAVPLSAPIEGGSTSTGDRHAISIDIDNCILYELYNAYPQPNSWNADSGAIYNLYSNNLRPLGWTSADAAGLPIFPGLFRYDEVAAGEIRHALRFTVPQTQRAFVWPARHYASSLTGAQYPPMGARFRLRADFNISTYSPANQVILKALKKYGMILADNGSAWFISGAPDDRWNNDDLHTLGAVLGSDFEAVDVSSLMIDPNSGQARQPSGVSVAVTPSTATVQINNTQQFSATVTNASQLVNWSVNSAPGGNSTVGTIGAGGLYTAPAVPPSGGTVTVQAASVDSPSAVGTAAVTITAPPPPPALGSVSPNSGVQSTNVAVTLNGSNFISGATVAVAGTGVTVSNVVVSSSTKITATFNIAASATLGAHNVTVTTSAGTSGVQPFNVTAPPPTPVLNSLTPNSASRNTTVNVTIAGSNFTSPATIAVAGGGFTVTNVVVVNSTTITATFKISKSASRQAHNTTVTTQAGTSNALPFTVH